MKQKAEQSALVSWGLDSGFKLQADAVSAAIQFCLVPKRPFVVHLQSGSASQGRQAGPV